MNLQVEKEKGEEILDIFKNYVWRTSMLDEIALPRRRRMEVVIRRPPSPSPHIIMTKNSRVNMSNNSGSK
jgi:hypothetical protein